MFLEEMRALPDDELEEWFANASDSEKTVWRAASYYKQQLLRAKSKRGRDGIVLSDNLKIWALPIVMISAGLTVLIATLLK